MTAVAACGACQAGPAGPAGADTAAPSIPQALALYLPDIHCAACISTAESALAATPGVRAARVNLTLRRAAVEAEPWVAAADLVAALDAAGITAAELDSEALGQTDPAERALLVRVGVAGFAMMNVMLLSVAVWSGAADHTRELFHWISALIAVPTVAFAGQPFFRSAAQALRVRRLNMDVPISVAILLATGLSLYETAAAGRHAYFDAAVSLTFFLLVGRYLDLRMRGVARSAARELSALEVPRALRLEDGRPVTVRAAALTQGDLVLVPPGSRLPADGTVAEGRSEIDRSLLTGETAPIAVGPGDELAAGEINLTGPLTLRVTAAGRDTRLARIAALVEAAESARSRYVTIAERVTRLYAPVVHLTALGGFLWWYSATGDLRMAVNVAVATLIITCPCALGLAIPAVSAAASGRLYRQGVLIKSGTALERLAEVDTVVFDKTGTLTEGRLRLRESPSEADLVLAAGLALGSTHPLALAVVAAAEARGLAPAPVADRREHPGDGIEGWLAAEGAEVGPTRPPAALRALRSVAAASDGADPARRSDCLAEVVAAGVAGEGLALAMAPDAEPSGRQPGSTRPSAALRVAGPMPDVRIARGAPVGSVDGGVGADRIRAPAGPPGSNTGGTAPAGRRVRLGRAGWIGLPAPERTATCLDRGDGTASTLTFEDVPRPGAAGAVAGLARLGLPAALVSGDAAAAAQALAAAVGIAEVHAPERPEDKAARVRALTAAGRRVLMVGDGLNDTAALAEAHASIAPASALDATRVVADVVLTGASLAPVAGVVATARAARARMRENLVIAAAYNVVAIPLALTGQVTPLIAALAMSASSICVSLNALRLR